MDQIYVVARFKIHANRLDEFEAAAADCVAGARSAEPGTLAYDWFLSEDRSEALVLEAYRGSEGVFAHMKNSAARMPKLLECAQSSAEGLGAASDDLRGKLSGRIAFLPRFLGLDAPTLADSGSGADITTVARFRVHPGKMEEFKSGVAAGLDAVAEKDKGTTAYEWFLDEPAGQFTVIEKYRDMDALMVHSKNVGHLVRGLMQCADLSAEIGVKGPPSSLAALAKLPMKRYAFFQGL
jgi:quinol monooxygenase YgiN